MSRLYFLYFAFFSCSACLDKLYVMAFTGGDHNAGSDRCHNITIRTWYGDINMKLPNLPGDDYLENKGDLWKLSIDLKNRSYYYDYYYGYDCITKKSIQSILLTANNNDGWMLDSVVTFVCTSETMPQTCQLATQDLDIFKWVDGDSGAANKKLKLSLYL